MWVRRYWVWQNPVEVMWDFSALTGSHDASECGSEGIGFDRIQWESCGMSQPWLAPAPKWECFWLSGNWPGPHRRDLSISGMHLWRCSNYLTSTANTMLFFVCLLLFWGGRGGGNCGSYYCIKLGLQPCQALNFTEVVSNWNRPPP